MTLQPIHTGYIVEETTIFTLGELSRACGQPAEWILSLVSEGVIDPLQGEPSGWRFRGECLRQIRIIRRLEADLGLNVEGAALVLNLLDEVDALRQRVAVLEQGR